MLLFGEPVPLQFLRQHILLSLDLLLTHHISDLEDCGSITDDCDNSRRPATEGEDGSAEDMDDDDEVEDEDEDSVIEGTLAMVDQTHYEQDMAETFGTVSSFCTSLSQDIWSTTKKLRIDCEMLVMI